MNPIQRWWFKVKHGHQFHTTRNIAPEKLEEARKILLLRFNHLPDTTMTIDEVLDAMNEIGLNYLDLLLYDTGLNPEMKHIEVTPNTIQASHITPNTITTQTINNKN